MIIIDGSYREGGGQILRTSLSLSCLMGLPFRMFNIRKKRRKQGLAPQHLTAIRAAQLLTGAAVKGDAVGSTELSFSPAEVRGGDLVFDIGTAGSTSLVLQTLIPAIALRQTVDVSSLDGGLTITLKGGTHVPLSPSFHYLSQVFAYFMGKIGICVRLSIKSYGFYPKGGGTVRAEIFPARKLMPLKVPERGGILRLRGSSAVGNLPLSIAERQRRACLDRLLTEMKESRTTIEIEQESVETFGQGTFLFLLAESENSVAGFTSLGERGKRAEGVGEEAAAAFLDYYSTGAALDEHMSDQIVLYLSLCKEESEFTTSRLTDHLLTNLWVISRFHEFRYSIAGEVGQPGHIRINYS